MVSQVVYWQIVYPRMIEIKLKFFKNTKYFVYVKIVYKKAHLKIGQKMSHFFI